MPAEQQPLTELTMRDVLLQVDRRLTLIEDDLRTLDQKWEQRFGILDQKIDAQTNQLRQEMNTGFVGLHKEMNTKFHWTLGVVLASWISTIGTLLLK